MTREELRQFIINELKTHRPDEADRAEEMADFVMSQPPMQSERGVKGFLKGYLESKEKHEKESNQ